MKYLFTLTTLFLFAYSSWAQDTTMVIGETRQIRVDEILYNKQTGEKMTGEQLNNLLIKTPGLVLEPVYNREGKPYRFYYDPENPFFERKRNPELQPKINKPFPPTTFTDLAGKKHHLDSLLGQWIIVDFNFLPSFIKEDEMEKIASQLEELRQSGIQVQGFEVLSSQQDPSPVLTAFQEDFTIVTNAAGFFEVFHINSVPFSFLIDPKGILVKILKDEDRDFKSYILEN